MLMEKIDVDFNYSDERGSIKQLIRRGYSQVNVITSKKGVFRGRHYHKYNTEAYYIILGCCKVTAYDGKSKEVEVYKTGDFFRIGPYVVHDFDYLEDSILVTMYSLGVELEDGIMDTFTIDGEGELMIEEQF